MTTKPKKRTAVVNKADSIQGTNSASLQEPVKEPVTPERVGYVGKVHETGWVGYVGPTRKERWVGLVVPPKKGDTQDEPE